MKEQTGDPIISNSVHASTRLWLPIQTQFTLSMKRSGVQHSPQTVLH